MKEDNVSTILNQGSAIITMNSNENPTTFRTKKVVRDSSIMIKEKSLRSCPIGPVLK